MEGAERRCTIAIAREMKKNKEKIKTPDLT
jgi:hypothetical protein